MADGRARRPSARGLDAVFLIWDISDELQPGRARAGHGVRAIGFAWVDVGGHAERLRRWLAEGDELPIRVSDGEPGIHLVAISTPDGVLVIE